MNDDAQAVIQRHSRSFSRAATLLPQQLRDDVQKLYAWCRVCDNVVDDGQPAEQAAAHLRELRADVERIAAGLPPVLAESQWLAELMARYQLPKAWPLELLNGMEADLNFAPKRTLADVEHYAYQVAGVVGLMLSRVLGSDDPRAQSHAVSLGIAMQLSNIARDVAEDARRGRCYLPTDWLREAATTSTSENAIASLTDRQLRPVLQKLLQVADRHYRHARQGLHYLPRDSRLAIRVAADLYQEIGQVIRRADYEVMSQRHRVKRWRQYQLLIQASIVHLFRDRLDWQWLGSTTAPARRRNSQWNFLLPTPNPIGEWTMNRDTLFLATFGLSLSCVMATVMFALVGINPKLETYNQLPWFYAGGSACAAVCLGWLAKRINPQQSLGSQSTAR